MGIRFTAPLASIPEPGLIALGQLFAVRGDVVSAAVAVDRQRAEWVLFTLTAATAAIALMVLMDHLVFAGVGFPPLSRLSAIDCASLGMIIATAACLRAIERYETHRSAPSTAILWTFAGGFLALAICLAALVLRRSFGRSLHRDAVLHPSFPCG